MKVEIYIHFDLKYKIEENFNNVIQWNSPVLPRIGEYILRPLRFLPDDAIELYKKTKMVDILPEFIEYIGMRLEQQKELSLYDWIDMYEQKRYRIESVEWAVNEQLGDYPIIFIMPE